MLQDVCYSAIYSACAAVIYGTFATGLRSCSSISDLTFKTTRHNTVHPILVLSKALDLLLHVAAEISSKKKGWMPMVLKLEG
jgi:hypothetical protein